jgi:hypothetical protein
MTRPLVVIAAIWLFIWVWRKYGSRQASLWACLILMSIYPFAFTGMLLPSIFGLLGLPEISVPVRIAAGIVAIVGAMIAAKHVGWGNVLGWAFSAAMVVSFVVIMGFLLFMMGVVVHATAQGFIFMLVLMVILFALSHGYRARGH